MLNTTTGYALRVLIVLARVPAERTVSGRCLAEETGVPVNYLSKLLLTLRNAGLVTASRGIHGGYKLSPGGLKTPLERIVEVFEGPRSQSDCVLGAGLRCSDEEPCAAHGAWRRVRRAYSDFLEHTTIEDLAEQPLWAKTRLKENA